jgi:hypothetical protein
MDEIFTKKVRAVAVAGWWTLLIVRQPAEH